MRRGSGVLVVWGASRFTRLLEEIGIDQLVAKVPQRHGKVEVLTANVQRQLFNQERFLFEFAGAGGTGMVTPPDRPPRTADAQRRHTLQLPVGQGLG